MRQRSLLTSHSYHTLNDDSFPYFVDLPEYKNYDIPSSEQWMGNLVPSMSMMSLISTGTNASLWKPRSSSRSAPSIYIPEINSFNCVQKNIHEAVQEFDALVTPHGTVCLNLPFRMRVDLTVDKAIRIINFENNIILALNETGSCSALLHPNGRVYQYGSRVEILAYDPSGNNKYAKMWYKGVSFTSQNSALIYLVDSAGTRTTTDSFTNLHRDFSLSVFYSKSRHGIHCISEAISLLEDAQFWENEDGVSNWVINNIRISQMPDGLVRIARNKNKYLLRTSPVNGSASLTTPFLHATASLGQMPHLFVRRGERRMHFDCTSFVVRNAGHSAGFNEKDQLKVH